MHNCTSPEGSINNNLLRQQGQNSFCPYSTCPERGEKKKDLLSLSRGKVYLIQLSWVVWPLSFFFQADVKYPRASFSVQQTLNGIYTLISGLTDSRGGTFFETERRTGQSHFLSLPIVILLSCLLRSYDSLMNSASRSVHTPRGYHE